MSDEDESDDEEPDEDFDLEERRVVLDTLTNDEASTDQELKEYFTEEVGLSKEEASYWVGKRNQYLNRI